MNVPREERRVGVQGYLRSTGFNLCEAPRLPNAKKMIDLVTNMLSKAGAQRIPHEIKIASTFNQHLLKNEPLHVARGFVFRTRGSLPARLSQPVDPGGVGGLKLNKNNNYYYYLFQGKTA